MKTSQKRFGFMILIIIALFCSFKGFAQNLETNKLSVSRNVEQGQLPQAGLATASENAGSHAGENVSPFDAVKGKREDISKRDAFSKHYINPDGSFTALIGAGPIHYEKNGQFLDIDHSISASNDFNYPYANTTNLFESYFGATAQTGVKNKTAEGEIQEFLNTKMYWEVNGQPTNVMNAANAQVSIQGDKAYYPNLYGNISAEFTMLTGKRKLNYNIPNQQALGTIPAGADYLVFSEDVVLPFGWTNTITENGILIKDQLGKEIYLYENPVSTDASHQLDREQNTIFETIQLGNTLIIKTKVKTEWLLNTERQFPVMVDPTVDYFPNASTHRTAQMGSSGVGAYGTIAVGYQGGYYRSYASFDVTAIPDGVTISSTVLYHTVGNTLAMNGDRGSEIRAFLTDPENASYTTWLSLYNAVTLANNSPNIYVIVNNLNSNGQKNVTLGATANTHLTNAINSSNKFTIGYRPSGTYSGANQIALLYGEDAGTNRPFIKVTYTAPAGPPSCATLIRPLHNSTGQAHQQRLAWNASAGATGYNIYFGDSPSSLTLVSSNQSGTTFDITDCLQPLTTYYWRVDPINSYGPQTGCTVWNFTTDNKIHLYANDFENASLGYFGTSGGSVDGWNTNNNTGSGVYNNTWTVGNGPNAIHGKSAGLSAILSGGLAGDYFQYWSDLGEIHRWIYRPFDMTGIRDIELNFSWKSGGEANQDYGSVISSINGGANWLMDDQGGLNNDGRYWNSPTTIRNQTIVFPESRNNQSNFVLGFKWDDLSGNGYSLDPSFVVDDIILKGCPAEGDIASTDVEEGIYEWIPDGDTETILSVENTLLCAQYQWEQSIDLGDTWNDIPGATDSSYTTPSDLTQETWYRVKVYFSTGCPGVYQEEPFKILLGDCSLETIWNGTAWSNGVPDSNSYKIVFEGDYTSSSDANYPTATGLVGCSVEVRDDSEVVISAGHSVTIDNELIIDNANGASFTLKSDANLLQINPDVENEGEIIVEREATVPSIQYNYWASPVKEQPLYDIYPDIPTNRVMTYNTETDFFNILGPTAKSAFGIGYSIKGPTSNAPDTPSGGFEVTAIFVGEPHNESATTNFIPLETVGQGFNLIGNPFPSNLNLEALYALNEEQFEVADFYFWDNTNNTALVQQGPDYENYEQNNYAAYNVNSHMGTSAPHGSMSKKPNGIVKPGQGILIQASDNADGITITNSMRTIATKINTADNDAPYYKNGPSGASESTGSRPKEGKFWLELVNPENIHVQIAVGYLNQADDAYDKFDTEVLNENASDNIYSFSSDTRKLAINGRKPFTKEDIIPLGVKLFKHGKYKILLEETQGIFAGYQTIYLKDKQLNIIHNLTESAYELEGSAGEFTDRFEILYTLPSNVAELTTASMNQLKILQLNEEILISSSKDKILEVEVFNLAGWPIYQKSNLNANEWKIPSMLLGKQIIVVKVLTETGEVVTKKIINK